MLRRTQRIAFRGVIGVIITLVLKTWWEIKAPTLSFRIILANEQRFQVLDRRGEPLGISYQNRFNTLDALPLHAIPAFLRQAFITSEDRHFFTHHGIDWSARLSAVWQNLHAGKSVRGASTISEQVIRILHPRPRTLWSRWLEGCEATWLEWGASKGKILEFYFN